MPISSPQTVRGAATQRTYTTCITSGNYNYDAPLLKNNGPLEWAELMLLSLSIALASLLKPTTNLVISLLLKGLLHSISVHKIGGVFASYCMEKKKGVTLYFVFSMIYYPRMLRTLLVDKSRCVCTFGVMTRCVCHACAHKRIQGKPRRRMPRP